MLLEDMHGMLRRLKEIEVEIHDLHKRIDQLESKRTTRIDQPITADNLTKLPNTLRNTMIAITQLKEAPAEIVAKQTNRTRGMESIYLNQLVRMRYLKKIKKGKRIYFRTLQTI